MKIAQFKPLVTQYADGVLVKFNNRRTGVANVDSSDDVHLIFKRLLDKSELPEFGKCTSSVILKDKLLSTSVRISRESAEALFISLKLYLTQ